MIQKLEHCVTGTDYGCGGASFSEVIDKVNEVIDYINSRSEEGSGKMTDQEIDRWVEEHLKCPYGEEVLCVSYDELPRELLKWGKLVAKKFYKLGKNEKKTIKGLTCRDLKKIHKIVEAMLKETKEVYIEGQKIYGVIYPAFRASEKAFYTEVLRRLKGNGMDEN